MSIDVKGPQGPQQPKPAVTGKLGGPMAKGMIDAGTARGNAEAMFDLSFLSSLQPAEMQPDAPPVVPDQVDVDSVREQLQSAFSSLKEKFLKVKPDGAPAEPFASSLLREVAEKAP